jgi:hypothetical protein
VKSGKERGLEEPVWERVMGRLLGVTRWVGRDGGRRGGLGLSGVVCAGGTGGGRSGEELKEGEPRT